MSVLTIDLHTVVMYVCIPLQIHGGGHCFSDGRGYCSGNNGRGADHFLHVAHEYLGYLSQLRIGIA